MVPEGQVTKEAMLLLTHKGVSCWTRLYRAIFPDVPLSEIPSSGKTPFTVSKRFPS